MTRINTNVSSLVAQNILGRSNDSLNEALTRLSTGLRINTGKDDPAGLIASENLRSDITSIKSAIGNTERANQVIATADSALGQVSSLLNDIRGLVTESANVGALSQDQIDANQLQVDSSLEALNRIAQTTTFQGRKILDGSLAFLTENVQNVGELSDLQIEQANLGTVGSLQVEIDVVDAAQNANIATTIDTTTAGAQGTLDVDLGTIDPGVVSSTGNVNLATAIGGGSTGTVRVDATAVGPAFDGIDVVFVDDDTLGANAAAASYNGTDTITVRTNGAAVTTTTIADAINSLAGFEATEVAAGTVDSDSDLGTPVNIGTTANGRAAAGTFTVETVDNTDTYNGLAVEIVTDAALVGATDPVVAELITDSEGNPTTLRFRVDGSNNAIALSAFQDALDNTTATAGVFEISGATGGTLDGSAVGGPSTPDALGDVAAGEDPASGLLDDVVFELAGRDGSESFDFQAGTSGDVIANAINLVSDATGVTAEFDSLSGDLTLSSSAYGSSAFVKINVLSEGSLGTFASGFAGELRDEGTDVNLTVNGVKAKADGFKFSVNTATLDLKGTLKSDSTATDIDFNIVGGGAQFQLGPDVVSNQQARIGITSVNTAQLGGENGKLFQLGSGGSADLTNDPTTAARIIEEAINQITSLRGRLGAFQRTSLETNRNALNDTLTNLTEAESLIRDADFAAETAALTRAQILVQSGTAVLAITNQNPQNVLALLR